MMRRLLSSKLSPAAVDSLLAGLSRPKQAPLRIDRFPAGIDGVHIDVSLGPVLEKSAKLFVGSLLQEDVSMLLGQTLTAASDTVLPIFRDQLREHHDIAVKEARDAKALERMQLFQLAVLKLLLREVDAELAGIRQRIESELDQRAGQSGGRGLALHREATLLSRASSHIRFRAARRAVGALHRLEHGVLRTLRQSVLGQAWPVSEAMLFNPLLQLDGVGGLQDFKASYPAVLHDLATARRVSDGLMTALSGWLPDGLEAGWHGDVRQPNQAKVAQPSEKVGNGQLALQPWVQGLIGAGELSSGLSTWFDEPANLATLLGGDPHSRQGVSRSQRHLVARFGQSLRRNGLHRKTMAAYAMVDIYPRLGLTDAEVPVFEYLAGEGNRKQLQRRLEILNQEVDVVQVIRRIDEGGHAFRQASRGDRQQIWIRLATDFCTLRRDLKLASQVYDALARIRLLSDAESLDLARHHNTLQLFCPRRQASEGRGGLTGHAILRVDVRGSNDLVSALLRRGMKPAAFFSRHLYDPVSQALSRFDAQKVTIEAGAMVLTTLEYAGARFDQLPVARACALAMQIREVGEALNAETERMGLQGLEFSLGVVFSDTPPTYLYDQSRRVLVSEANTRARQMATCHSTLRHRCSLPGGQGLCVASPVPSPEDPIDAQDLVRYNVNGIELDTTGFARLSAELSLRKVKIGDPRMRSPSKLYVGQCPDAAGEAQWIVVREQPVKLWMGRQLLESAGEGRTFFELVSDPLLLTQVLERLGETAADAAATVRASRL